MPTKVEKLAIAHMARSHNRESFGAGHSVTLLRREIEAKWPGSIERARARYEDELDEKRFEGKVPDWAKRYVRKYEASKRSITLAIRHSRTKPYTSGHCAYWSRRLVVTFGGTDEKEHRYVVLHEIAHANEPGGHDDDFYDELFRLVRAEGLYRYCIGKGRAHYGSQGLRKAASRARAAGRKSA